MNRSLRSFLILGFLLGVSAHAADELKLRDEVVAFLKKNVIGKTVSATNPRKENEDFSQSWTWTGLAVTEKGFTFDELITIKQTRYEVDKDGKRTGEGTVRDRGYANKNFVGFREGVDLLLGIKMPQVSTFRDTTGTAYSIDTMRLDGDKLYIEFTDVSPNPWPKDPPAKGFDQIKSKHTETIWVDDKGKLNRTFTQLTSYIDMKTGAVLKTLDPWKSEQKEN